MEEAHLTQEDAGRGFLFLNERKPAQLFTPSPPAPSDPFPSEKETHTHTHTSEHSQSPHFLTLRHLPESQVQHFKAGELRDSLQSPLGDLGTSIQVDAHQLGQVVGYELQPFVCDAHALSNVQGPQFVHLPHHAVYPVVRDVAGAQRQRLELVQSLSNVRQGLVPDLVAEGDVQPGEPKGAHGEVHSSRVTDVVTRAQVEVPKGGHVGQVDHPSVRDPPAEA